MKNKMVKKIIAGATLGVLLLSQTVYASAFGNVNVSSLNVRAGASTNDRVIKSVGKSDYIHILDKANDGWYAIETDTDQLGYVSGQYIDIQKARAVVNANNVNVRSSADYSAPVLYQAHKNNAMYAYAQVGDWILIQSDNQDGYIHREFVDGALINQLPNKKAAGGKKASTTVAEKSIAVATTTINLRQDASITSSVIGKVSPATVLTVANINGEWAKVTTPDNTQGYMAKEYLNIGKENEKDKLLAGVTQSSSKSNQSSQSSIPATDIISYSKQFLGNPYVYGGNSLTSGVDCSGFTSQVFKNFGVSLSRNSADQYRNNGVDVDASNVRPGDLMFYGYGNAVSHVAIYVGNGQVIEASTPQTGITIGRAFRTSGKQLIGIKRVL